MENGQLAQRLKSGETASVVITKPPPSLVEKGKYATELH